MKANSLTFKNLILLLPASLVLGTWLAFVQNRNFPSGIVAFSLLFLLSFLLLNISHRWAGSGRALGILIALAFFVRLGAGISLYVNLPVYGHADSDDRAGYVFTDAHTRDLQAWMLASSDEPILDAFSRNYSSDQYGGLLAFNAALYRYLSPDVRRPLMLILFSAFFAALGIPFLWRAVNQVFGEKHASVAAWIFSLFPESILLGASAMREPYLHTFSAMALWGFVDSRSGNSRSGWRWLGLGILGMLLVSPAVALVTIVILAGWIFFAKENHQLSWKALVSVAVVFILGLFLLSSSLNRSGQFEATSPLHVINDWLQSAVKWDIYQLERGSGWVQKIFDESPSWIRLPFVAIYGILQPVLPATFVHPSPAIWKMIGILRALGWYTILPMLILSFIAANGSGSRRTRNVLLWLSLLTWTWILLAALRGGGDLWDNPRYRTILFLWQAILAGYVWIWWRETRNPWLSRIVFMEVAFLVIFTHWYGSRYYHWAGQLPFPMMVALILAVWGGVLTAGWWRDRRSSAVDKKRA